MESNESLCQPEDENNHLCSEKKNDSLISDNSSITLPIIATLCLEQNLIEIKESPDTTCLPLKDVSEVVNFQLPEWAKVVEPLKQKSDWCVLGKIPCHVKLNEWRPLQRCVRSSVPRTLVCHDMRGGYLEDRFVDGSTADQSYTFQQWWGIDIFVYFSHCLVSIPPLGWINAGHRHGVKILGTIITEWNPGAEMLSSILKTESSINSFIDSLISITSDLRLDGWFLNIENVVENIKGLKMFVHRLNIKLKHLNRNHLLIWYDSVTDEGNLKWQNELNDKNKCWFDMCDGIFLNYTWTEENLKNTLKHVGHRILDIFVGVDVFSRNCTGGMDSFKSLDLIRKYGLSVALFAPGWTHETTTVEPKETFRKRFEEKDKQFWFSLKPYLYEHGPNLPFRTTFGRGFSEGYYNINDQEIQLCNHVYSGEIKEKRLNWKNNENETYCFCLEYSTDSMIPKKSSICISNFDTDEVCVHRLMICDIKCDEKLAIAFFIKPPDYVNFDNTNTILDILLMIQEESGSCKTVLCGFNDTSNCISRRINSDLEVNSVSTVSSEWKLVNRMMKIPNIDKTWNLKYYIFNMPGVRILEIGACLSGQKNAAMLLGGIFIVPYKSIKETS